ncbi:MAG: DUF4956 domain-containing protein [Oscillospiraceae bacterium]|nr:DUF4956 domain-containing protein [Oscillospiraceae bacterium]
MTDFIFKQVNMQTGTGCLFAMGMALLCGLIVAVIYRLGTDRPSKYMMVTTLIMPAVVQAVIMLVNGSIGTGVAVAGAFSLVRFRSVPGSSRDICILFLSMASGLACGMGYVGYSVLFTVIISLIILAADKLIPSENSRKARLLRILVPEDMDYCGLFDDIFKEYTSSYKLNGVKSVRMGTMFDLQYTITMKDLSKEKEMLDKIRCRNGNLTISCGLIPVSHDEL